MMVALVGSLYSIALLCIAGAGFAVIGGQAALRDRCLTVAITCIIVAMVLPIVAQLVSSLLAALVTTSAVDGVTTGGVIAFITGHVALGLALLRRRGRGQSGDELEAARTRSRPRLSPENEETGR
jgi:hypothetical protein